MNKLKITLIGAGHLGKIHIKLLAQNSTATLLGIYDTNAVSAAEQAELYNVKCFSDLDEAISEADAVFIIAPTTAHFDIAQKALLANKHVFIEKPVCGTVAEAKELIAISNDNPHLKIQVGHIERFNSAVIQAKKYSLQPKFIESHRLAQFRNRSTDVSVIHDLMIHDIDLALWMVNSKVKQIDANGVSIITKQKDLANARIQFENGTVANLTASRISAKQMRKFRLFQQYGYMSLDLFKGELEVFRLDAGSASTAPNAINKATMMLGEIDEQLTESQIVYEKLEALPINAMAQEQQAFIDCIINNTAPVCSLTEGTAALEIADLILSQL